MNSHSDIVIVGGGVSGMLTARELRLAGRNVTIIDKTTVGQESSWAGGGILLPIYPWRQSPAISQLVLHSLPKFPELNQQLFQATAIDPEWWSCGMLICKNPDIADAISWCEQHNIVYATSSATADFAAFAKVLQQPLWLPHIAQIRNPRLLKALKAFLVQLGVVFLENIQITRIETQHRQVQRLHTSEQKIYEFQELVVCGGAWTTDILQFIPGPRPDIQPIKGQMLVFDAEPGVLKHMLLNGDHYLIPRRDGKILAGSTVESSGFDKSTTQEAKEKLYAFAIDLLPVLRQYEVCHHWAGLRPGSPAGVPVICRHPDFDNLSINAGHFRNGLVMGPASAQLLADLILERTPCVDSSFYRLS